MDIDIKSQIFSGDLGVRWDDPNAAADDLAAFIELTWLNDLQPLIDEGHHVSLDIVVDHNATSQLHHTTIECVSDELKRRAIALMTEEGVIRQRFANAETG